MALLITLFLVLINIFNNITTNSPKAEGLTAIEIWMLACILFVFGSLIEYAVILFKKQKVSKYGNPVYSSHSRQSAMSFRQGNYNNSYGMQYNPMGTCQQSEFADQGPFSRNPEEFGVGQRCFHQCYDTSSIQRPFCDQHFASHSSCCTQCPTSVAEIHPHPNLRVPDKNCQPTQTTPTIENQQDQTQSDSDGAKLRKSQFKYYKNQPLPTYKEQYLKGTTLCQK